MPVQGWQASTGKERGNFVERFEADPKLVGRSAIGMEIASNEKTFGLKQVLSQ
jgi:hypothetical protein